jgi:RNA polymerase-binding transcription factor DksA
MSGYGRADEEQENAQAIVEARREAQPGCRYCITCQVWHDKMPNLKVVTKML